MFKFTYQLACAYLFGMLSLYLIQHLSEDPSYRGSAEVVVTNPRPFEGEAAANVATAPSLDNKALFLTALWFRESSLRDDQYGDPDTAAPRFQLRPIYLKDVRMSDITEFDLEDELTAIDRYYTRYQRIVWSQLSYLEHEDDIQEVVHLLARTHNGGPKAPLYRDTVLFADRVYETFLEYRESMPELAQQRHDEIRSLLSL